MAELNPYAPPPIIAEAVPLMAQMVPGDGLWRQDKLLVMRKDALLPDRCVKSNQPTKRRLKRNLVWYPKWLLITLLGGWLPYVILVLVLQKKATIQIGLTEEWLSRRWQRIGIAWGLVLLGFALFAGGIAMLDQVEVLGGVMMLSAIFMLLGGAIYGLMSARMVYPKKIDDRFVWLQGVAPEYLAELPIWTGPRA
ncbi:MAG TPA: hypothetical protein VL096_06490 [Pirellulaceae bacterium]|nr:hypothetical protein [Pirellulaceae bacterium]